MKKVLLTLTVLSLFLSCERRSFEDLSEPVPLVTTVKYNDHIKPLLQSNCTNCHSATGSASYYPLATYAQAKAAVDNILLRIQKPAGDPEKMPAGGSLPQSSIELIKQWKTNGLLE